MRARSAHFTFDKKVKYKDLEKAFKELFNTFLEETGQMPHEEPEYSEILLEENLRDLRKNRKPEGYNRDGSMRLMFPIAERVEFYIYSRAKSAEVPRVAETLSKILQKAGLKHQLDWDKMLLFAESKPG
jgi:mRNA-degrading endonuclease RelE of RelBE toxin-antitoxin system